MEGKVKVQINFGIALKKALSINGLTMCKLAVVADMKYAHIQRIAVGRVNLELTTIIAISEGLQMKPSDLFSLFEKA